MVQVFIRMITQISFNTMFKDTLEQYQIQIEFVSEKLGDLKIRQLEKLATSLYVIKNEHKLITDDNKADFIHNLKPHISKNEALEAIKEVKEWIEEVRQNSCKNPV